MWSHMAQKKIFYSIGVIILVFTFSHFRLKRNHTTKEKINPNNHLKILC